MRRFLAAFVVPLVVAASGCGTSDDPVPMVIQTPLPLDPTHDIEIAEWWTNDSKLLHLDDAGRYKVYHDRNRYGRPADRGRWSRDGYAVIWLESYEAAQPTRTRVSLSLVADELALTIPGERFMRGAEVPPPVLEDLLVAEWRGDDGLLYLYQTMLYSFSPASGVAGHSGRWEVDGQTVILHPQAPNIGDLRFEINIREDDAIGLKSSRMSFERTAS